MKLRFKLINRKEMKIASGLLKNLSRFQARV